MPFIAPTTDKALIGAAGVHFVAAELSLRGLIALPTVRNTAGIDIVSVNAIGSWVANIQVKTSRSKVSFWPVSSKFQDWVHPNNYYVFVRYLPKDGRFEAFVESSEEVAKQVKQRLADDKKRGCKDWAPCWFLEGRQEILAKQWAMFGNDAA